MGVRKIVAVVFILANFSGTLNMHVGEMNSDPYLIPNTQVTTDESQTYTQNTEAEKL